MEIEKLSIVRQSPPDNLINDAMDFVLDKMENQFIEKRSQEREERLIQAEREGVAPPPEKDVPDRVNMTTDKTNEVMFEFSSLPYLWQSSDPAEINLGLDQVREKIDVLQFHEEVMDDAMADLQVAVFKLFFNLDFEEAELVYPAFKVLNLANNYVMETRQEELTAEVVTMDNLFSFIREQSLPRAMLSTTNAAEYTKGILYRFILERIGSFDFPVSEEGPFEPVLMSLDFLKKLLPSELLVDLQILSSEETGETTFPYLTKFEKSRLIGHRATELSMGARPEVDVGDLTEAIAIAEKELREQVIPTRICRRFPDGSRQIWCAASIASRRDDFYKFVQESLDGVSIEDLYRVAVTHGYGVEAKDLLLELLKDIFAKDFEQEISEVQILSPEEQDLFVDTVYDILKAAGVSDEDIQEPRHILRLLLPLMKTDLRLQKLLANDFAAGFFDQFENVEWVNITGNTQTNPEDAPRHLTDEEMEDILSSVPQILSAAHQNAIEARLSMLERIKVDLKDIVLCPSAIPEFKQQIRLEFTKSRIDPGSAVGINAADALGEQVSQMTLNTFHSAGASKNMSSGIQALSELIYAMKTRKWPNCKIVFKERLTFDEILDKEASIVETTVADLFEEWVMESPDKLEKYWWHRYFELPAPNPKIKVLRLYMNATKMLERKVTMKDVVEALKKGQGKEGIPSSSMYFAHSSTADGILDIYPNPEHIKDPIMKLRKEIKKASPEGASYREEFSIDVFIDNIILPNLENIRIKGVSQIKEIYPVKSPVWKIVANERKASLWEKESMIGIEESDIHNTYWILDLDQNIMSISAVKPEYLYEFLEALGYRIIHVHRADHQDKYVVVRYQEEEGSSESSDVLTEKPSNVKTNKVKEAKQLKKDKEDTEESSRILDLESYYFLNTKGSYLTGLMEKEEVDSYYTYCNNIHLMALSLGVEAARQFFIKELYDTFTTYGGYVNPRNILLLADFLFSQGSFLGTNYTGMSAGTTGYFSLATFERSLQTLEKAAVFGEEESLEGVSAAIAVGKPVSIGTGFFDIISNPIMETMKEKTREEPAEVGDLSSAFEGSADPFDLGEEFDPVAERDAFRATKKVAPPPEKEKEIVIPEEFPEIPEYEEDATPECPTTLSAEGPSEALEELMEKTVVGPDPEETIEEELQVDQITVPSKIKQRPLSPLRMKPFATEKPAPALSVAQALELEELGAAEIEELEEDDEIPPVAFTRLPVIKAPPKSGEEEPSKYQKPLRQLAEFLIEKYNPSVTDVQEIEDLLEPLVTGREESLDEWLTERDFWKVDMFVDAYKVWRDEFGADWEEEYGTTMKDIRGLPFSEILKTKQAELIVDHISEVDDQMIGFYVDGSQVAEFIEMLDLLGIEYVKYTKEESEEYDRYFVKAQEVLFDVIIWTLWNESLNR